MTYQKKIKWHVRVLRAVKKHKLYEMILFFLLHPIVLDLFKWKNGSAYAFIMNEEMINANFRRPTVRENKKLNLIRVNISLLFKVKLVDRSYFMKLINIISLTGS
jgi:hypothetical protein